MGRLAMNSIPFYKRMTPVSCPVSFFIFSYMFSQVSLPFLHQLTSVRSCL